MIYRDFHGMKLSALGFGAMRLPVIDGDDGRIDETAALRMVETAMQKGINYYDTAWGYHGGNSELIISRALSRYPRDSYYLATKFPGYDPSNWGKVKEIKIKILHAQLLKLLLEYLLHLTPIGRIVAGKLRRHIEAVSRIPGQSFSQDNL